MIRFPPAEKKWITRFAVIVLTGSIGYGIGCWRLVHGVSGYIAATLVLLAFVCTSAAFIRRASGDRFSRQPNKAAEEQDALMELEIKRAEIAALQSQINPHFLSNTLESIRGQALWDGKEEIAEMAETLSLFFRYGVGSKGNLVRLSDELRYVELYFKILKYRFDERFRLTIVNEEEDAGLLDCLVPKLMIQPAVENAVYHGLELRSGPGNVEIRLACTEKSLLIRVVDDGVGIDIETLARINTRLQETQVIPLHAGTEEDSTHSGIAIFNINARINRYFGSDYGVSISSAPDVGTELEITLPKMTSRTVLSEKPV